MHCVVVTSIDPVVPSFVLFVLGTDSKYGHKEMFQRWMHIEDGLLLRWPFSEGDGRETRAFQHCQ